MLIGADLLSPATMLFNKPTRHLSTQINTDPINIDNDDLHHEALGACQRKRKKGKDTQKDPSIFIRGVVHWEYRGP